MTTTGDKVSVVQRVVVSFDVCSSSNIIEDLTLTDNIKALRDLLLTTRTFLRSNARTLRYETYKFTGDGWILLFPGDVACKRLLSFLTKLSVHFGKTIEKKVFPLLESIPPVTGLTFGIDRGPLVRAVMDGDREYIGRPLNIASRLQNILRRRDPHPEYKVLMSAHLFNRFPSDLSDYRPSRGTRTLRNIRGGQKYRCVKLSLPVNRLPENRR